LGVRFNTGEDARSVRLCLTYHLSRCAEDEARGRMRQTRGLWITGTHITIGHPTGVPGRQAQPTASLAVRMAISWTRNASPEIRGVPDIRVSRAVNRSSPNSAMCGRSISLTPLGHHARARRTCTASPRRVSPKDFVCYGKKAAPGG
jgi:hypothetical protein